MSEFDNIINWENVFRNSETLKNNDPQYGFVKEVFVKKTYDKLYQTYPKEDDGAWYRPTHDYTRSSMRRNFGRKKSGNPIDADDDPLLSKEWNILGRYFLSNEFAENISKYTGIKVSKVTAFNFINLHKGDFNLPHNHFPDFKKDDSREFKLTILMYFTKNWQKGDPGGTYICTNQDESSIVFEPYDLDNSMICFAEGPKAWHGSRIIMKDVVRQSIQFNMD